MQGGFDSIREDMTKGEYYAKVGQQQQQTGQVAQSMPAAHVGYAMPIAGAGYIMPGYSMFTQQSMANFAANLKPGQMLAWNPATGGYSIQNAPPPRVNVTPQNLKPSTNLNQAPPNAVKKNGGFLAGICAFFSSFFGKSSTQTTAAGKQASVSANTQSSKPASFILEPPKHYDKSKFNSDQQNAIKSAEESINSQLIKKGMPRAGTLTKGEADKTIQQQKEMIAVYVDQFTRFPTKTREEVDRNMGPLIEQLKERRKTEALYGPPL